MTENFPANPPQIAIVGCWGVPARYGGFETSAEQLARAIRPEQAALVIYGQRSAYTPQERAGPFAGHRRRWMPFSASGPQSMLHDALQLLHAATDRKLDSILLLGVSGAWALPIVRLLRPRLCIVTNIDGLEWRRAKFGKLTHTLLRWLERRAVSNSDAVIADNAALVPIIRQIHAIEPVLIAYGGDHIRLMEPQRADGGYFLSVARIEPENNPGAILEAARRADVPLTFVGNWNGSAFGQALRADHAGDARTRMQDPVYDQDRLATIRAGSIAYVHGHSVGGTNPSLTEALFHSDRILAYDCAFNRATLDGHGAYWSDAATLGGLMADPDSGRIAAPALAQLRQRYRWRSIADAYLRALTPSRIASGGRPRMASAPSRNASSE